MKRIYLLLTLSVLFLGSACSSGTAYSEEEKKTQDSADEANRDKTFESLESMDSDSTSDSDTANEPKEENKKQ